MPRASRRREPASPWGCGVQTFRLSRTKLKSALSHQVTATEQPRCDPRIDAGRSIVRPGREQTSREGISRCPYLGIFASFAKLSGQYPGESQRFGTPSPDPRDTGSAAADLEHADIAQRALHGAPGFSLNASFGTSGRNVARR